MSDALSESRRIERMVAERDRREKIIQIGHELTEIRAQREELQLRERDLEAQLDEFLRRK